MSEALDFYDALAFARSTFADHAQGIVPVPEARPGQSITFYVANHANVKRVVRKAAGT